MESCENFGKKIISLTLEKSGRQMHPRIILTEDRFAFLRGEIGKDTLIGREVAKLRDHADKLIAGPHAKYELRDGLRLLYVSREALERITVCALAYHLFGEEKYAGFARDEMLTLADFPDFHPYHFLDTTEICCALGIGYDWLYQFMTKEEKATIRKSAIALGYEAILDDFRDRERKRTYRWYQDKPGNNWKFVCCGGLSVLALAIFDEDESGLSEEILTDSYLCIHDIIRKSYNPLDGSYVEGLGYWNYATLYLAYYASALESACGTTFDLLDTVGMRKTGSFPPLLSSNTGISFNFSDSAESYTQSFPCFFWLGHALGQYEICALRKKSLTAGKGGFLDLLFYHEGEDDENTALPLDFGCVGSENATFRTDWNDDGLFAGIHFAKNDAYHGHSDMGTFILDWKGQRFFRDLGAEDYNLPNYRKTYRIRAEGHNCLLLGPDGSDQELHAGALIRDYYSSETLSYAEADLSEAYPERRAVRRLTMNKTEKTVTVTDTIRAKAGDRLYWFAHTKADVILENGGKSALLSLDDAMLRAEVTKGDLVFSVMDPLPLPDSPKPEGQAANPGVKKLFLFERFAEDVDEKTIEVRFTALDS